LQHVIEHDSQKLRFKTIHVREENSPVRVGNIPGRIEKGSFPVVNRAERPIEVD
jgi:hypothetical protein